MNRVRVNEVLQFAVLGLGAGACYGLAAQGIVLVYRGSGVLNFAHGAIGMIVRVLLLQRARVGDAHLAGVHARVLLLAARSASRSTC